jgi:hypothetical protein
MNNLTAARAARLCESVIGISIQQGLQERHFVDGHWQPLNDTPSETISESGCEIYR